MAADKDITHLIERLELFEEKLGVRLEALYATFQPRSRPTDSDYVVVYGELHSDGGTTLKQNTEIVLAVYDSSGRLIGLSGKWFLKDKFFGFEAFGITFQVGGLPVKVRVYPKS